jgi:hypothetical protein
MIFTLTTPLTIGDLSDRLTITRLQLAAISFNFQDIYASKGAAVMSAVLEDPDSKHTFTITYGGSGFSGDVSALAAWRALDTATNKVTQAIFAKLIADGKLPPGTLA